MIAIFLRELRENIKWAAMIFVALMFVVIKSLRDPSAMLLFQWSQGSWVLLAPAAGLAMGIVQTIFETRPDNWAFVVHRPVSKTSIFIGKSAAGLTLLYLALALPCVVLTAWAARPGNLAMPFQWRMVLPLIADVLAAGCYYFAAMVITLRRARWYGSRLLPIGLALICTSLITLFMTEFWQAVIVIFCVMAISAVAAWGVFTSNGVTPRSSLARFALCCMIYPGAIGVLIGICGVSQDFTPGIRWRYFQIDQSGNLLVVTRTMEEGIRGSRITDVDGNDIAKYENVDLDDPASANLFVQFNGFLFDDSAVAWPQRSLEEMSYRFATPGLVSLRTNARGGGAPRVRFSALYVVPDRIIDLYDPLTHALIGQIGPAGFTDAAHAPSQRFDSTPVNLSTLGRGRVLAFNSHAYWLDLGQRRVRLIFTAPTDDPIVSAAEIGTPTNPTVALATRNHLYLIQPNGKQLFSTLLDVDLSQAYIDPAVLPDNGHLLLQIYPKPWLTFDPELREYSLDGKLIRTTSFPPLPPLDDHKLRETATFGASFPLAAWPFTPRWALDEVMDVRTQEFPQLFNRCMIGAAIASALLSLFIAWKYRMGVPKTIGWTIAGGLLGPGGVLVMLSVSDRPIKERCTACKTSRVVAQGNCPKCSAPPAPVESDGREIFEPVEAFQMVG